MTFKKKKKNLQLSEFFCNISYIAYNILMKIISPTIFQWIHANIKLKSQQVLNNNNANNVATIAMEET